MTRYNLRTTRNIGAGVGLAIFGVIIAGIIGWTMNIISLMGMPFTGHEGMFVLRVIGIFVAPLGGVLGYF